MQEIALYWNIIPFFFSVTHMWNNTKVQLFLIVWDQFVLISYKIQVFWFPEALTYMCREAVEKVLIEPQRAELHPGDT